MLIDPGHRFLLSPPAVSLIPILVLHLAIFVYLCRVKEKSVATHWLNGWLASVMAGDLFMFLGGSVYGVLGGCLEMGSLVFFYISIVPSLQFAYHFPRPAFGREARRVLVFSAAFVAVCLGWLVIELLAYPSEYLYSFEQYFYFNPVRLDTGLLAFSIPTFDAVYSLSLGWMWVIWLRKTVYLNAAVIEPGQEVSGLRRIAASLILPRSSEARVTQAFSLMMLCAAVCYILSTMELWTSLLSGSFVALYLAMLAWLMLIYINNTSAPTSFMVKLVGISLVTLLIVLGMAIPPILNGQEAAYDAVRLTELPYVVSLVTGAEDEALNGRLPDELEYVVARPALAPDNPLPTRYQLLFARQADFSVEALAKEDARLVNAMQVSGWKAGPWLNPEQALVHLAGGLESYLLPENRRAYRGIYAGPSGHYIRYTLRSGDGLTVYEAGYNYLEYRRALHQAALPLAYFVLGAALLILLVFPRFFRSSLVQPLQNLLEGVGRVRQGELAVKVPISARDEIGYLTDHFNRMVVSLQTLTESLQAEIGERQRAEEEVRSLNATLEQRIAYRTRELTTLYEIAAAASQSLNQETLLTGSLLRTLSAIPADAGAIYLLDETGSYTRQASTGSSASGERAVPGQLERLMAAPELQDRMIRQSGPLLIPNVADDPGLLRHGFNPQSLLAAPLRAGGEMVGYMGLVRGPEDHFMLDEIALLTTISQQVAIAVQGSRLRQKATLHEERERIARDLHDSVTQSLYGLLMLVENGQAQLEDGKVDTTGHLFNRMAETTRQAIKEMRLFIHQLRPSILAEAGLVGALHQRLAAVEGRASVQIRLVAGEGLVFPAPVESAFYWIAQEALNNSLKHAHATAVNVVLGREGKRLILEITDNGSGFAPDRVEPCGLGLSGMRERAAQVGGLLEIISAPGAGTTIRVSVEGIDAYEAKEVENPDRRRP